MRRAYTWSVSIFQCALRNFFAEPSGRRHLRLFLQNKIPDRQHIHLRPPETIEGLFGPANDRLVIVKRSVQHHGHAGQIADRAQKLPIERIRSRGSRFASAPCRPRAWEPVSPTVSPGRTAYAKVIKGEGCVFSKNSPVASSVIEGAKGRNISRCLMRRFRTSFISARRGSARMLRLPSARGPHSVAPWNQPTIFPAAMCRAVRRSNACLVEFLDVERHLRAGPNWSTDSANLICRKLRSPIRVIHREFARPPRISWFTANAAPTESPHRPPPAARRRARKACDRRSYRSPRN